MQTTAIETVANSLPKNEVISLTILISGRYILFAELRNIIGFSQLLFNFMEKLLIIINYDENTGR